jgi:hypothetical protein
MKNTEAAYFNISFALFLTNECERCSTKNN